MDTRKTRNLQLDVLRGVAILLVFGRHLELPRPEGLLGAIAQGWFRVGWLGVDLFFVLSGFLIGGLLVGEVQKHGRIDVARFLIRRGLKIYPPYFAFIGYVMLMPVAKAVRAGGEWREAIGRQWDLYWPNLLFLQNYVGTNPEGHTWSLAVEEHFYLLLPFALALLAAMGRVRALIPLCLVLAPVVFFGLRALSVSLNDSFATRMAATHLRLDALLFGVGIRALAEYLPEKFAAARSWRAALAGAGIALWAPNFFVEPGTEFIRTWGLAGTFLGAAAFLVAAYQTRAGDFGAGEALARAGAGLVAWIGVHSYAIYLWHVTVMGILAREIGERLIAANGGATSQWIWLLSAVILSAGAAAVGMGASRLVEWPVLRLRDRLFPSRSGSLPGVARAPEQTAYASR